MSLEITPVQPDDNLVIDASPVKGLFISMLTVDLNLVDAIIDLVDNCIDGAVKLRAETNNPALRFDGLQVDLRVEPDYFGIADNCGGMSVETARRYAFRFGREDDAPHRVDGSVGQYGVGMKRALFKLGKVFSVEARSKDSHFGMSVDVIAWKRSPDWTFRFTEVGEHEDNDLSDCGTTLSVPVLNDAVVEAFSSGIFTSQLRDTLTGKHRQNIVDGLAVFLNGVALNAIPETLRVSLGMLEPGKREFQVETSSAPISVTLVVGVGESDPEAAGWYVFCNGRAILEADRNSTTGWDTRDQERIPRYHNQFSRFRGYAYLSCLDPTLLPVNTTKTNIDVDSKSYKAILREMVLMMRPVITYLNNLDRETDTSAEQTPLRDALDASKKIDIQALPSRSNFHYVAPQVTGPKLTTISYKRPEKVVEKVKKELSAKSAREVGEMTFDYYCVQEIED